MYKIHINDSVLYLIKTPHLDLYQKGGSALIFKYNKKTKYLLNFIDKAEKSSERLEIWIHHTSLIDLKKDFFSLFKVIKAGGGLVLNNLGQVLMIFRRGMWDLPKGKKEGDETKKQTAKREVIEETGLDSVHIIQALPNTYHTYKIKKKRVLKLSFWYVMETDSMSLIPQTEEDIEEAIWADIEDIKALKYQPIYNNIDDLLKTYIHSFE